MLTPDERLNDGDTLFIATDKNYSLASLVQCKVHQCLVSPGEAAQFEARVHLPFDFCSSIDIFKRWYEAVQVEQHECNVLVVQLAWTCHVDQRNIVGTVLDSKVEFQMKSRVKRPKRSPKEAALVDAACFADPAVADGLDGGARLAEGHPAHPPAASPAEAPLEEAAVAADAELVGVSPREYLHFYLRSTVGPAKCRWC